MKLIRENRYNIYRKESDSHREQVKYLLALAKVSILGAEQMIERGEIPASFLSDLKKSAGLMEKEAMLAEVSEKAMRFYGDNVA